MTYPSRMDLSMHSLQKRCKHSITVRVFRMIPSHKSGNQFSCHKMSYHTEGQPEACYSKKAGSGLIVLSLLITALNELNFGSFYFAIHNITKYNIGQLDLTFMNSKSQILNLTFHKLKPITEANRETVNEKLSSLLHININANVQVYLSMKKGSTYSLVLPNKMKI